MLRLSYMLLKKRIKFVTAIVGTISLSAMLVIFANITMESIYEQKKELALKTYGSFICGVNQITARDMEIIRSSSEMQSGFWELYGNARLGNSTYTVGYGDQTFLDMTNADLEAGRMPESGDEIAVERFVAEQYGISEPGSHIELSIHNEMVSAKVTGILRNYTNQLSVYYRLEKGKNNYPNILCSKESVFYSGEDTTFRSALFGFSDTGRIGMNQMDTINTVLKEIDALDLSAQTVYTNDNLFNRGVFCGNMKLLSAVFSYLVMAVTLLCSYGILRIFYREYGEKLGILMALDLQRRKAFSVIAIQCLLFAVLGGGIGAMGGTVICHYCYHAVQVNYDGFPDYELFSKEIVETETQNGYVRRRKYMQCICVPSVLH